MMWGGVLVKSCSLYQNAEGEEHFGNGPMLDIIQSEKLRTSNDGNRKILQGTALERRWVLQPDANV